MKADIEVILDDWLVIIREGENERVYVTEFWPEWRGVGIEIPAKVSTLKRMQCELDVIAKALKLYRLEKESESVV